jgi:putative peptide zinc metalloprotease protein
MTTTLDASSPPARDVPEQGQSAVSPQVSPWRGHSRRTSPGQTSAREVPGGPVGSDRPKLAEGVTLVGEYEGSGYRKPHFLARRSNGTLIQLSHLLHLTAAACDGTRDHAEIARVVSAEFGRPVSEENVRTLVERLRPLGVLAARDGTSPPAPTPDPLLGLKYRTALVPARWTPRIARVLHPLFWPVVVLLAGTGLIAFDIWLFFSHGLGASLRSSVQQPLVFLLVAGLIVVSAALHELGHAAGCSYGGARPGRMGAGVYIAWPAFYTDVTDAYRLDRRGRLRTDLGGVYFNTLVVLALATLYHQTGYEPLLLVCFVVQAQILQQMLPLLRLDGYYVLSDAVGVPDLFRRIGPILASALPWWRTDPAVHELRTRARLIVTAWVLVVVPLLLVNLLYLLLSAPRIAATTWDTGARLWGQMTAGEGAVTSLAAGVQMVFLLLPVLGITLTMSRLGRRGLGALWRWGGTSPPRRALTVTALAASLAVVAFAWWPDARLSPYREGERGTLPEAVRDVGYFRHGTPLLRSPAEAQRPLAGVEPGASGVGASAAESADAGRAGEQAPEGVAPTGADSGSGTTPTPTAEPAPAETEGAGAGDGGTVSDADPAPAQTSTPQKDSTQTPTTSSSSTSSSSTREGTAEEPTSDTQTSDQTASTAESTP